jgi:hypothetical protein
LTIAELLLAIACAHWAGAEVRVQGDAKDVRVEARGATVAEILTALAEHDMVKYRGTPGTNGITATFEGPLRRVLARVLEGNDYVIKRGGDTLEVIVLSPGSPAAPSVPRTGISPQDFRGIRPQDPFTSK